MAVKPKKNWQDDWLDDQKRTRFEKKSKARKERQAERNKADTHAEPLDPAEANATVAEVFPQICRVILDPATETGGGQELLCQYRRAAVFHGIGSATGQNYRERSPVAVGDRVRVRVMGAKDGVVEGLARRRNQIFRPAPGRDPGIIHVLASNVDRIAIVTSLHDPDFSSGVVDRFLIAAQAQGVEPMIVINKMDLAKDASDKPWLIYADLGFACFPVSVRTDLGVDALKAVLAAGVSVFCGHSGVGKTSLLRAISGSDVGRVGDVNRATGKGRHTTTGAVLVPGPEGTFWIDTPGVKEFGLIGVSSENLVRYFKEFDSLECAVRGCLHLPQEREENCRAFSLPRYESYLRIRESILESEEEG